MGQWVCYWILAKRYRQILLLQIFFFFLLTSLHESADLFWDIFDMKRLAVKNNHRSEPLWFQTSLVAIKSSKKLLNFNKKIVNFLGS